MERGPGQSRAQGAGRQVGEVLENGAAESLSAFVNMPFHRMEMILRPRPGGLRIKALHAQAQEELLNAAENQNAVGAFEKALFLVVIPAPVDHWKCWTQTLLNGYAGGHGRFLSGMALNT